MSNSKTGLERPVVALALAVIDSGLEVVVDVLDAADDVVPCPELVSDDSIPVPLPDGI